METALQFLVIYLAIGFVPVAIARLVAGTRGARSTAHFVFWRGPRWLASETFWLLADTLQFCFFPHTHTMAFVNSPPPLQDDPVMPPKAPPPPLSLADKMRARNAEELRLIAQLIVSQNGRPPLIPEPTLARAFDLDLIDQLSVHHHQALDDGLIVPLVSISFILRPPVSTTATDKEHNHEHVQT